MSSEQLAAAQTRIETEPECLVGAADPGTLVTLALARGLGLALCAPSLLAVGGTAVLLWVPNPVGVDHSSLLLVWALTAVVLLAGLIPGVGLLRGRGWARAPAMIVPWLALLLSRGSIGANTVLLFPVALLTLGFLRAPLQRWLTPPWRAAAASLSVRPYLGAVSAGLIVLMAMPWAMNFKVIFASMGVELPLLTRLYLDLAEIAQQPLGLLLVPAAILLPTPLLRLPPAHERTAFWLTITGAVLAAWASAMALFLPIFELQRALAQ